MPNPSSTNHYLPQFYLKAFCASDKRLCRTYVGPDSSLYESRPTPKTTGYEEDLYTFRDTGSSFPVPIPDYVESDVLRTIDDDGAVVFRKVLNGDLSDLTQQDRIEWAAFVCSLLERHPRRIRARNEHAIERILELTEQLKVQFGPTPDGEVDVFRLFNPEDVAVNLHLAHVARTMRDAQVLDYMAAFKVVKIKCWSTEVCQFITGDNAVVLDRGEDGKAISYAVTLSPDSILYGFVGDVCPEPWELIKIGLQHIPRLLAQCQYVFSRELLQDTLAAASRTWARELLEPVTWK